MKLRLSALLTGILILALITALAVSLHRELTLRARLDALIKEVQAKDEIIKDTNSMYGTQLEDIRSKIKLEALRDPEHEKIITRVLQHIPNNYINTNDK